MIVFRSGFLALLIAAGIAAACAQGPTFKEVSARVNGVRINYKIAGNGPVVLLLHGYAQTSRMWTPLIPALSASHTVIAPDLPGAGASDRAPSVYDKKTLAVHLHDTVPAT